MVTQVGVHQHNVVVHALLEAVDIGGAEAELSGSGVEHDFVGAVDSLQLLDLVLSAVRRVVVDDDDLHFDLPAPDNEQVGVLTSLGKSS